MPPKKPEVEQHFDKNQLKELRAAFKLFDVDNDGKVTYKELGKVLKSLGKNYTDTELKRIIKSVDLNKNGTLDFDEFLEMMRKIPTEIKSTETDLTAAFKVFDKNGDGKITAGELRAAMTKLGEKLSQKETEEMIKEADLNGDGVIDYYEFVAIMVKRNDEEIKKYY